MKKWAPICRLIMPTCAPIIESKNPVYYITYILHNTSTTNDIYTLFAYIIHFLFIPDAFENFVACTLAQRFHAMFNFKLRALVLHACIYERVAIKPLILRVVWVYDIHVYMRRSRECTSKYVWKLNYIQDGVFITKLPFTKSSSLHV